MTLYYADSLKEGDRIRLAAVSYMMPKGLSGCYAEILRVMRRAVAIRLINPPPGYGPNRVVKMVDIAQVENVQLESDGRWAQPLANNENGRLVQIEVPCFNRLHRVIAVMKAEYDSKNGRPIGKDSLMTVCVPDHTQEELVGLAIGGDDSPMCLRVREGLMSLAQNGYRVGNLPPEIRRSANGLKEVEDRISDARSCTYRRRGDRSCDHAVAANSFVRRSLDRLHAMGRLSGRANGLANSNRDLCRHIEVGCCKELSPGTRYSTNGLRDHRRTMKHYWRVMSEKFDELVWLALRKCDKIFLEPSPAAQLKMMFEFMERYNPKEA